MACLEILTHPDHRLHRISRPVERADGALRALVGDLIDTLRAAPGVGLAAPQVGVDLRVVIIDLDERPVDDDAVASPEPLVLVNPVITWRSGDIIWNEGCLSVPGLSADVSRAEQVRVEAIDRDGQPLSLEASGLLAVCLQHELDHLDGILYIDRLPPMERAVLLDEYARVGSGELPPEAS